MGTSPWRWKIISYLSRWFPFGTSGTLWNFKKNNISCCSPDFLSSPLNVNWTSHQVWLTEVPLLLSFWLKLTNRDHIKLGSRCSCDWSRFRGVWRFCCWFLVSHMWSWSFGNRTMDYDSLPYFGWTRPHRRFLLWNPKHFVLHVCFCSQWVSVDRVPLRLGGRWGCSSHVARSSWVHEVNSKIFIVPWLFPHQEIKIQNQLF